MIMNREVPEPLNTLNLKELDHPVLEVLDEIDGDSG
jgi:hypothetical protein